MNNSAKQVIGEPLVIGGRQLSLSRAIRAGDFVYLTGQVPFKDGAPMTTGTIEDQTRAVLDDIKATLATAGCELGDVVKAMVWL
ncbi:MAG: RidA family protein, partial [Aestuariivirgaceae bacterium]